MPKDIDSGNSQRRRPTVAMTFDKADLRLITRAAKQSRTHRGNRSAWASAILVRAAKRELAK